MKIVLECASCGARYPQSVTKDWGRTKETSGYGPRPACVALVPVPGAPVAINARGETEIPQQVCGGLLAALSIADSAPTAALTPITL